MKIENLIKEILENVKTPKSINKLCSSVEGSSPYKKLLLVLNNSNNKQKYLSLIKDKIFFFKEKKEDVSLACMIFILSKHEPIDMKVDPRFLPLSFEAVVTARLQQMGESNG